MPVTKENMYEKNRVSWWYKLDDNYLIQKNSFAGNC